MAVTTYDIAKSLGLAQATVSRALRGDPAIAVATRQRVKEEALRRGYRPNLLARGLFKGRTRTLGVIVGSAELELTAARLFVIGSLAQEAGYRTYIAFDEGRSDLFREIAHDMAGWRVDGYLICSSYIDNPETLPQVLAELHGPKVYMGREPQAGCHNVVIDQAVGVEQLVDHLYDLGHRDIFMFRAEWEGPWRTNKRFEGFVNGLKRHGIEDGPSRIVRLCGSRRIDGDGHYLFDQGELMANMRAFLKERPTCTAIMCSADSVAQCVLTALNKMAVRVPEDVSVAGFDNISSSSRSCPPLTTVSQPTAEWVRKAMQILLEDIEEEGTPLQTVVVPTKLVVRESTGPVRSDRLLPLGEAETLIAPEA